MTYALAFLLMAAACAYLSWVHGGLVAVMWWPAVSFLLVAAAYLGLGPRVLGKRSDGRISWWAWPALLPFFLLTWGVWHLARLLGREPCCHQVAPRVWLGRRPLPSDLPAGVTLVVDLTAEFPVHRRIRASRRVVCVPTLDTTAPLQEPIVAAIQQCRACAGDVYIHCASGHGRSATFAAMLLVQLGAARDVHDAVEQLRAMRCGVRLSRGQWQMLERWAEPRPG